MDADGPVVPGPSTASVPSVALVERPWGRFSQYAHNVPVTVSLMTVKPGHRLSLQSHRSRGELWIVLDEGALVQVDDVTREPAVGDTIWIPATKRHRLGSLGRTVRVLEVAFGNWQQSDIVRFDDDYGRPGQGE
jgi:mannose-6-phosphate isomerase